MLCYKHNCQGTILEPWQALNSRDPCVSGAQRIYPSNNRDPCDSGAESGDPAKKSNKDVT